MRQAFIVRPERPDYIPKPALHIPRGLAIVRAAQLLPASLGDVRLRAFTLFHFFQHNYNFALAQPK